jgi:hypothetical protein
MPQGKRLIACDKCTHLIKCIKITINSSNFSDKDCSNTTDPSQFFPFTSLVLYSCMFTKNSHWTELNKFVRIFFTLTVAPIVSNAVLCKTQNNVNFKTLWR